ncbi:MAG: GNAT family N-acetyltransferase [Chitinophagaceae bacterium]
MDSLPEKLEDELVVITRLCMDDFEKLFAVASDPLIWEQHPEKNRFRREVFQAFFDGAIASKTSFLVLARSTGEVIGCTRFYDYQPALSSVAIGYTFLSRTYWGGKYNLSKKKLLLSYAFKFVDNVIFHVGVTNLRSQKAVENLGAIKVNEVNMHHSGIDVLHVEYNLSKQQWLNKYPEC